jgi:Ca-activated chloride channel family protein
MVQLLPQFKDWRRGLIVPLILAGSVLAGPAVLAQVATFSSGVNLVEVYATVTDGAGEPVAGLTAGDFRVAEDGAPQPITTFAAGEFPLSVTIAIDRSFSMAGTRLSLSKQAARSFIAALKPDDEVMVLAIGSEIETITPPVPAREAAATRWEAIDAWGTTPLYDATVQALDAIQSRQGRRALVLLSDGADRDSSTTASALIAHARDSAVLVYPVAIGATRPPVFAELASVTGGRSLFVDDPRRLDAELAALARELRFQYLLGYAPPLTEPPAEPPGPGSGAQWRSIQVTVSRPDVRVRARDGYFAR